MSLRLLTLVWQHAPYKDGALLLLLALADFSDDAGVSWPSVETLAAKARMGERHARRLLRQFEIDGFVATEERGSLHKPNLYTISAGKLLDLERRLICPPSDSRTPMSEEAAPDVTEGGSGCPARGASVAPQPSVTVKEPSLKRKEVELPPIPLLLNTPAFQDAWLDWQTYRKDRKMALTATTAKVQFQKLECWGVEKAIQAIRDSIANNWQGFFEPRNGSFSTQPGGRAPMTPVMR